MISHASSLLSDVFLRLDQIRVEQE